MFASEGGSAQVPTSQNKGTLLLFSEGDMILETQREHLIEFNHSYECDANCVRAAELLSLRWAWAAKAKTIARRLAAFQRACLLGNGQIAEKTQSNCLRLILRNVTDVANGNRKCGLKSRVKARRDWL